MAYTDPCSDGKRQQSADLKLQNFHKGRDTGQLQS